MEEEEGGVLFTQRFSPGNSSLTHNIGAVVSSSIREDLIAVSIDSDPLQQATFYLSSIYK